MPVVGDDAEPDLQRLCLCPERRFWCAVWRDVQLITNLWDATSWVCIAPGGWRDVLVWIQNLMLQWSLHQFSLEMLSKYLRSVRLPVTIFTVFCALGLTCIVRNQITGLAVEWPWACSDVVSIVESSNASETSCVWDYIVFMQEIGLHKFFWRIWCCDFCCWVLSWHLATWVLETSGRAGRRGLWNAMVYTGISYWSCIVRWVLDHWNMREVQHWRVRQLKHMLKHINAISDPDFCKHQSQFELHTKLHFVCNFETWKHKSLGLKAGWANSRSQPMNEVVRKLSHPVSNCDPWIFPQLTMFLVFFSLAGIDH